MFDIGAPELLLCVCIAILVIGPKDLPAALRLAGRWVARGRGVMRQFRSGFDDMVREAEMEEMEKKWAEKNAQIMRDSAENPPMQQIEVAAPAAPDADISDNDHKPEMGPDTANPAHSGDADAADKAAPQNAGPASDPQIIKPASDTP